VQDTSGTSTSRFFITFNPVPNDTPYINIVPDNFTGCYRGQTAGILINIERNNVSGPVQMTFDGQLPGLTRSFTDAAPTGNQTTCLIDVAQYMPVGQYVIYVRGRSTVTNKQSQGTFVLSVLP
jgi:hypothetical protein